MQNIILILLANFIVSCGAESLDYRTVSDNRLSLVSNTDQEAVLTYEFGSLFKKTVSLDGVDKKCKALAQDAELQATFKGYEYLGVIGKQCIRRDPFKSCETYQYIHKVKCSFEK